MGLAALRKVLHVAPFDPEHARGSVVAVDADNLIWSFVTAIAGSGQLPTAPDGKPIAHLIGLSNRLRLYAQWGVRSVWVFDGAQPNLKAATLAGREARIAAARAAGQAQAGASVGAHELSEAREMLLCAGVPFLVAPGESDAQCAQLVTAGQAFAAVTQDYDAALFGCPRTLRNFAQSKTRHPEVLDLPASLAQLQLTRAQLVDAAILVGTDYNEGIRGVGPLKAIALLRRHGDLHGALEALKLEMPDAEAIRDVFLDHPVDAAWRASFAAPDDGGLTAFLEARGISAARAQALAIDLRALHSRVG